MLGGICVLDWLELVADAHCNCTRALAAGSLKKGEEPKDFSDKRLPFVTSTMCVARLLDKLTATVSRHYRSGECALREWYDYATISAVALTFATLRLELWVEKATAPSRDKSAIVHLLVIVLSIAEVELNVKYSALVLNKTRLERKFPTRLVLKGSDIPLLVNAVLEYTVSNVQCCGATVETEAHTTNAQFGLAGVVGDHPRYQG